MSLLMEHNVPVYKEFCKCLEENHECILITATGTGKSYIVEEFLQQHNEIALVVVPTKAIAKSWEDLSSNVSVVTYTWFMMHYNELVNQFVYAVFDEAHHIGGDGPWGIAFRNFKSRSTSTYLIGLTADSIRYNDKSKNVAEREFDGHIVYGYDTSEAVEKGILPNAQYVSALFDLPAVRKSLRKQVDKMGVNHNSDKIDKLFGRLDIAIKNYNSIQQILQYHLSNTGNRKGIVFVDSIRNIPKAINIMKSTFKNEPIFYIHSNLSSSEVLQTIDQFKETTHGYIIAVDMLNEGVHIDGVNTIIMLRKTKSPSVYKQQIGRALSSASPNELVYVFDFVGNSSEILSYYKISYNPIFQESDGINSYTVSDIGTKIPKISTQNIVDDSTKEIISIINQIQKFSKIKVYKDSELIEILNSCSTYEEAIEKTGLSYGYITSRAKELGLGDKLWDNRRSYDRDKIIPILEECNTSAEVAERLGLPKEHASVRYLIKKFGYRDKFLRPFSSRHVFTESDLDIIREMAKDPPFTHTISEIAKLFNVSDVSAYKKVASLGLTDRFVVTKAYKKKELEDIIEICKASNTRKEASVKLKERFPRITDRTINKYFSLYSPYFARVKEQEAQLDDVIKEHYRIGGYDAVHKILPDLAYYKITKRAKELGIRNIHNHTIINDYIDIIREYYPLYGSGIIERFNLPFKRPALNSFAKKHNIPNYGTNKTQNPYIIDIVSKNMNMSLGALSALIKSKLDIDISKSAVFTIRQNIRKKEAQ